MTCTGPKCREPARARGLCAAHYRWALRNPGEPLRPLRPEREAPLEPVSVRVLPATRERVKADPEGARRALDRWARRR